MEQISLENKVNNTLKWLANKIACIQVYHWNEEYKKKSLNDAWQKVQEQFKEDIDWNSLTESQCKALHFGRWQSEDDVEEEISFLAFGVLAILIAIFAISLNSKEAYFSL